MRYTNLSILLVVALAVSFIPTISQAGPNEVPNLVQQGIKAFEAKQYEEAVKAFETAREKEPNDPRILFNLGCVMAAQGKYDDAIKMLEDASLTDDTQLAVKCRYNLGQIAVDRAKAALGEKPEDADEATRTKVTGFIQRAMTDYSTCLEMDSNYADARHNLELLRIWQKNMQQTWKDKDRQKRRESMDLPKFVDWLDKEQRFLRDQGGDLKQQRKSPKRRLALEDASKTQRELSEEIDPLKQKITNMLNASANPQGPGPQAQVPGMPGAQPGMPGMMQAQQPQQPQLKLSPEQREKVTKAMHELAENAGDSMTTASQYLNERMLDEATSSQGKSIEQIDQIGAIITPYPELVKKAVGEQRQLTTQTQKKETAAETTAMDQGLTQAQRTTADGRPEPMREFVEAIEDQGDVASATNAIDAAPIAPDVSRTDVAEQPAAAQPAVEPLDPAEVAWQQRFVERWSQLLIGKAEEGLKNLPPEEPKTDEPNPNQATKPDEEPEKLSPQEQAAKAEKEKIEGLRESMKRAVKLGPEVVRLTKEAAWELDSQRVDEAVPHQEKALELLEKIAEPLKDKNQQDQNKDQQQNQQNQDQKDKKDQQNKDQNKNKDGQQQPKPQPQQPKPQNQDQKQKPNQGNQQKQKIKVQPQDLSKRQAEALIRKVKERQDEAEKIRVMLQEKAYGKRKVEKDW